MQNFRYLDDRRDHTTERVVLWGTEILAHLNWHYYVVGEITRGVRGFIERWSLSEYGEMLMRYCSTVIIHFLIVWFEILGRLNYT